MSATATSSPSDYVVGYGRPPKEHQFAKGQSGNPAGRAKGSQNFDTALRKALNERVVATIDGQRMEIPKYQAIASQLVNQAASGVFSALKFGIEMWRDLDHRDAQAAAMQRDDPDRLANDNAILMAHNFRVVVANKSKTAEPATHA